MDLMDLLQWQLSDGILNGLNDELHIGDHQKTQLGAQAALSVLMSAVARNATQSRTGLQGLAGALERDHDGSVLDDLMGVLRGRSQPANRKAVDGAGILGHLLGQKQSTAVDTLSRMTGMDRNQSMAMLIKLAPMVLGVLGRYKKQKQMDAGGLQEYLRRSQKTYVKQNKGADIFMRLLDQDGDGSVADEVAGIGMKMLGRFFRK